MTEQAIQAASDQLVQEVKRRRTFAIISHPDAGKTTLTEKLLLYSGAVDQAGMVRNRKSQRHATSDWMSMEQERGISITSTVLQFEHGGFRFNLLDTPGHQDFSEDTYRTLMAVDSAIMVLDRAKGIEAQTLKLFDVCRRRNMPILTFINKMDREGRDPFELLDEVEQTLGIAAVPMNWPITNIFAFQGVYDLIEQQALLFERTVRGQYRAPVQVSAVNDPTLKAVLGEESFNRLNEDVELIQGAGQTFDREAFLAGKQTPVFFGSAINNFGVEPFLAALTQLAPAPLSRMSSEGEVQPTASIFTGFVFKIQANMDPKHRDRMAFVRICSGRFEKDMQVYHARLGRKIRMGRPHRLFARDRETIEEAFPGDVIGLSNPGYYQIGDTICSDDLRKLDSIPRFQPEHFAILQNIKIDKYKQFNQGVTQLEEEGVIQVFYARDGYRREPILAAVGELQFDVVQARMESEYNVDTRVERQIYSAVRWVEGPPEAINDAVLPSQALFVEDHQNNVAILFRSTWDIKYAEQKNPSLTFRDQA